MILQNYVSHLCKKQKKIINEFFSFVFQVVDEKKKGVKRSRQNLFSLQFLLYF